MIEVHGFEHLHTDPGFSILDGYGTLENQQEYSDGDCSLLERRTTMENQKEYMDALLSGKPIEVVNQPVALDPDVFTPRKGILTRYGRKLLREGAKFYSRVSVSDMVMEKDMQEIVDDWRDKALGKYRSIDDPWEPS